MTFRVLAPLGRTLGITRIEDGQGRARERERKRRKKGALGKPNSGEEEKRGGRVHSQSRKKTGGGCCEKEGASFVVRRGREADVGVWIGQCRPLSISDSVPSTTQAGQSESELCRGTVTTFPPSSPQQIWLAIWWVSSVSRSSLTSRLLRICCVCQSDEDSNFGRCRTPRSVAAGPNPDPDR